MVAETIIKIMVDISDGNPGAINAMMMCMEEDLASIFAIEKSGLRGSQIWLAYKDYSNCDTKKMIRGIIDKDPSLKEVLEINGQPIKW